MYFIEEFVGALGAEEVFGCVGVGADDDGDAEGVHVFEGLLGGVVVVVTAFVYAAGVDFADAAGFMDELYGFVHEVAEPGFVVVEIAVAVVHDYLVEMPHDGGLLAFYHAVVLIEKGSHGMVNVATEKTLEAFIVGLVAWAVNHPKVLGCLFRVFSQVWYMFFGWDEVYAADGVLQSALLNEWAEVFTQAGDIVYLQTKHNVNTVGIFLPEGTHGVTVLYVFIPRDGESVLVGQGRVTGETKVRETMCDGKVHHLAWSGLAVAVAGMGMIVAPNRGW